jgi:hypothetical protein
MGRLLAGRIVVQEQEQAGSNSSFFAVKNPQIATTVASLSTLTTQRSRRGVRDGAFVMAAAIRIHRECRGWC